MSPDERQSMIDTIRKFPDILEKTITGLHDEQLDTPYGPGKWTIRQVVHHLADAHLNAFVRHKLIMTEDNPTLKTYDQDKWAVLPDVVERPVSDSLAMLKGLHARWCVLFESMTDKDYNRTAFHPEAGSVNAEWILKIYSNHCNKHLGHINGLLKAKGW